MRFCTTCGNQVVPSAEGEVRSSESLAQQDESGPGPADYGSLTHERAGYAPTMSVPAADLGPIAPSQEDTLLPRYGGAPAGGPPTQDWQSPAGQNWQAPAAQNWRSPAGQEPPHAGYAEPARTQPPAAQPPAYSAMPPAGGSGRRPRWPLLAAVIAVVVVGAGAGVAFAVLPSHHHTPSNAAGSGRPGATKAAQTTPAAGASSPAASQTASPAATLPPPQQAAQALANLLAQSGSDRLEVTEAVSAVQTCSGSLSQDETTFSNALSSRQMLLTELASLPDRSALPASMLRDLTSGWQASEAADQDFAQWTQDEMSHGCSTSYQSDPNFSAATGPDDQATKYKKAFARQWAPIAGEYGLPAYQYNQI